MSRVVADMTKCQGYANCVVTAPDHFDLGEDGKVRVLSQALADDQLTVVREAIDACPVAALRLEAP